MAGELVFVDQGEPGITRRRCGRVWAYYDAASQRITDREEIDRLNRIGLPPAYRDAWFCPHANGHLLATGIDARGRKQYRYHPDFRLARDGEKFDSLSRFGRALPDLRQRVDEALTGRGLGRERALASVVRLLDASAIRIGNEAYTRSNKSFGATTLRMRHARLAGSELRLRFRAKSGRLCEVRLSDHRLARFVRAMQDLPGQHLFQFLDDAGKPTPVGSSDVNAWLRETMGEGFTAKHFRTWTASVAAFEWLAEANEAVRLGAVVGHVSERLGNTPAIARKSYIHPGLIELASDGETQRLFRDSLRLPRRTRWLSRHERGLIAWLEAIPGVSESAAA